MSDVTKAELAEIFGISTRQVTNLENEGMPVKVKAGKGKQNIYDTKACIDWRLQTQIDAFLDGNEEAKNNVGVAYKKAAHRLKEAQAKREELRYSKEAGELLHVTEVDEAWSEIVESIRNQMITFPLRAYKSIMRLDNETKAIETLEKYSNEIQRNLSMRPGYEQHTVEMEPISKPTTKIVEGEEEIPELPEEEQKEVVNE